jgi:hypothetical protein
MPLRVIGAGFGRTGTLSLKLALEQLGLGRCYHMVEVLENPAHATFWSTAVEGEAVDWEALLGPYGAVVDWPACTFWRELASRYPEALVVLTVRDPEAWYRSAHDTIYQVMQRGPADDVRLAMARRIVLEHTFGGRFEDRAHAIDVYERHNEAVRRTIPAGRLLVYEVREGWEPLCRFLEQPVPAEPFPRVNTSEEFRGRLRDAV